MKEIIGQARYWVEENVSYLWISMKWAAVQDRERKIRLRLATIRVLGEDEQELCWSVGGGDVEERVLEVEQVRVIGRPELALDAVNATKRHQRRGSSCKSQRAGWVSRCEALSLRLRPEDLQHLFPDSSRNCTYLERCTQLPALASVPRVWSRR